MTVPQPPSEPNKENLSSALPCDESATVTPSSQSPLVTVDFLDRAAADNSSRRVVVPGYDILGELGRGGMGVVYKARQIKLNRLVALKMILSGSYAGEAELARFRSEAEAIARLHHVNVVQIYEIGEFEALPFFSLEFCEGGSLVKKLAGDLLPPLQVAALLEALARGIGVAHRAGVVHRDLKPGNVLLTEDGTPKITDFGLAKRIEGGSGLTQTGAILGTPSYMAPEQAEGKKDVGPPADVYALGAILYECLTGRPPFKAATPLDTVLQVVAEEPVPPARLNPRVPRDLETICLKCLQKDVARRYGSAEDLADDLARFQRGEPIAARPVGRLERGWRWCRRYPSRAAAAALALLMLAASVVVSAAFALAQKHNAEGLAAEQHRTLEALGESRESTRRAREAQRDALRQAAASTLERALQICEHGEAGRGLLWLARGLAIAEQAEDADLVDAYRWNLGAWSRQVHALELVMVHPDEVYAAVWSPDGQTIATGCNDGKARLWRSADGQPLGGELVHSSAVLSLAYRPDGRRLAACCRDGTVHVWDTHARRETAMFRYQPGRCPDWMVPHIAFSPDGVALLTGGVGVSARLWDAETGKPLEPSFQHSNVASHYAEAVAFHPNGQQVLTGNSSFSVALWEARSGRQIGSARGGGRMVSAAFSGDGKSFVTGDLPGGSPVGGAQVWDTATRKRIGPRLLHAGAVRAVGFRPDGKRVATGSDDCTARLWNATSGEPEGAPLFHGGTVHAASFRPDGRALLTASADRTARVWRPASGLLRRKISLTVLRPPWVTTVRDVVHSVAFSPDGKRLATAAGLNPLVLWDLATGEPDGEPLLHPSAGIFDVVFRPDGKALFTSAGVGQLRCWDLATRRTVWQAQDGDEVWRLALSPAGTILAGGTIDYKQPPDSRHARLWDAATGKPVGATLTHARATLGLAFSPDGETVLTGSTDRTCRLWNARTGLPLGDPLRQANEIRATAFSPDGRTALLAGAGRVAQRWSLPGWKAVGPALRHEGMINRVLFTPDGHLILTASQDKTARLWHPATGQTIGSPMRHGGGVLGLAISRDGQTVATGGEDNRALVWNMPTPLTAPAEEARALAEAMTGMMLDNQGGIHLLDTDAWHGRRQRFPIAPLQSVPVEPAPIVAVKPPPKPEPPPGQIEDLPLTTKRRKAQAAEIDAWIRDLNTPRAEAAARALVEVGPEAGPALEKAIQQTEGVARPHLEKVRDRLLLDATLQPRRVHLNLKDAPLERALAAVARQTDLPLVYRGASGKRITLHLDDVPAWGALDRLRRAAGLELVRNVPGATTSLILAEGPSVKENALAYAGPLRLEAARAETNFTITPSGVRTGYLQLHLSVRGSPSSPVLAIQTPHPIAAEDDAGHSLLREVTAPTSFVERGPNDEWWTRLLLKAPEKAGGRLKVFRGVLPLEVMVDRRDRAALAAPTARTARTATIAGGGRMTARAAPFNMPKVAAFTLTLTTLGLWTFDANRWGVELIDGKGRHHRPLAFQMTPAPWIRSTEPDDLRLLGLTPGQPPWASLAQFAAARGPGTSLMGQVTFPAVTAADPNARLVLYSYRRMRTTLPFEFHDLPLP